MFTTEDTEKGGGGSGNRDGAEINTKIDTLDRVQWLSWRWDVWHDYSTSTQ
jgi:hypothetical protein